MHELCRQIVNVAGEVRCTMAQTTKMRSPTD
jgi:hypothetical protein